MSDMETRKLRDGLKHSQLADRPPRRGESSAIVRWTIVIGVASWVAIALTLWSVYEQHQDGRDLLSAQISNELDKQFDSTEMRRSRAQFATKLKNHEEAVDFRVLDFFDKVAFYVRRGTVDKETADWGFSYWMERYWLAARDQVVALRVREGDPSLYGDLEDLSKGIRHSDSRGGTRRKIAPELTPVQIRKFLDEEMQLELNTVTNSR